MATDYPIALADVKVQLPGMLIGLPCTSPATTVSRRVPPAIAARMFMTGEQMRVDELQGAIEVVSVPQNSGSSSEDQATSREGALENRVTSVVQKLLNVPAQPQAFGKWAFWTQLAVQDGTEMPWAGMVMVQHSKGADAREGINAFLEKRRPNFNT
jgi:enoyl-CoA hydratase/carnithine racemase